MGRKTYRIPDQKSVTYGVTAEEIAAICGVGLRTACRWKSGACRMPNASKMILASDLGCFDPEWRGWTLRDGTLVSPEGWAISVNDVMASPLLRAQVAVYQAELRAMRAEAEGMEEQPLPDSWEIATG